MEQIERRLLSQKGEQITFSESLTGYILATQYLKVLGPLLDWSSIDGEDDSFITCPFINKCPSLRSKVDFLATATKNQPFLPKEEARSQLIKVGRDTLQFKKIKQGQQP